MKHKHNILNFIIFQDISSFVNFNKIDTFLRKIDKYIIKTAKQRLFLHKIDAIRTEFTMILEKN